MLLMVVVVKPGSGGTWNTEADGSMRLRPAWSTESSRILRATQGNSTSEGKKKKFSIIPLQRGGGLSPGGGWRGGGSGKRQGCAKALGALIERSSRDRPVLHEGWWPLPRGAALAAPSGRPRRRQRRRLLIEPISRYIRPRPYLCGPSAAPVRLLPRAGGAYLLLPARLLLVKGRGP